MLAKGGKNSFSLEEIAHHNTADSCWIVINGNVYDVTNFLKDHPGGSKVVLKVGGKDATKQFENFHDVREVLAKYGDKLLIGTVGSKPDSAKSSAALTKNTFGELVPFGDPTWYQGWNSPYYNDSHRRFRIAVRKFCEEELMPHTEEWDNAKTIDLHSICAMAYRHGVLGGTVNGRWPDVEYAGSHIAGGIKPEEYDQFHEMILLDECSRTGCYVSASAYAAGLSIGLPPVLDFGSKYLKEKVAGPCLRGEKVICLAITEPGAGSDVAKIQTEAKLTPDGKHFIVNGQKKWITNGIYADFFTTAVRTGGKGGGGISMLLIERSPGVTTKQMSCMGLTASGTTYITFEDVLVPIENVIGEVNKGFKIIMNNFNHERMMVNIQANRFARVCYEEAFKYACKRETFDKKLIEHPVIREKLAHMIKKIESTHALLESITYQLTLMTHSEAAQKLGGMTALCKSQATETFEYCAREASQIFGGAAYTKGGQGGKIERLFREARVYSVFAGSEEVMLDLGVRQAARQYKGAPKL